MSAKDEALAQIRAHLNETNRLFRDICSERREQHKALVAACKRSEDAPPLPDVILERFDTFGNYSHYHGHPIVFIGLGLKKLSDDAISPEGAAEAYKTIIECGEEVSACYQPAVDALLKEIEDHPERIKDGEEGIAERIKNDLALASVSARNLVEATRQLKQALGIGSGTGLAIGEKTV